jgi:hypothetical protein
MNPPRSVTLRSYSFGNDPRAVPARVRKEPVYRNTTVGFRLRARCRCPR